MKMLLTSFLGLFIFSIISGIAHAEVKSMPVEYKSADGTTLKGIMFWDDVIKGQRPGVLVFSEWMGLNDYTKMRATQLAKMGYAAFAADMYGDGKIAKDATEAGQLAGAMKADRPKMRERANAALKTMLSQKINGMTIVDPNRTAAIGFCFGGTTALELARSGADVKGIVTFHGGLDSLHPEDAKNIKAKILVLHGADDPTMTPEQIAAFQDELRKANVDWRMIYYGDAVHSFTNPASGNDKSKGVAYNERAAKRAWNDMQLFFKEIF